MGGAPGYMGSVGGGTPYARVAAMEAARKIMAVVAAQPQANRSSVIRTALDQIRPGLYARVENIASGVVAGGGSPATAYEEALRTALEAEYEQGQLGGCSACGDGVGGSDWATAVASGATAAATIVGIASGAPKQAERAARNNMLAAQATAGAAGQTAAAQVEIARIQAETARLAASRPEPSSKLPIYIGLGVLGLAVVGGGLFFAFKK